MKKLFTICFVAAMILAICGLSQATIYNYNVGPGNLAGGLAFDNGQGGEMFGYDPDQDPPIGSNQAGPTGFGNSCFWSDVQGSAAGGGRDYTSFRMSPKDIFDMEDVTISDLAGISYFTKNIDTAKIDWQLKIYTEGDMTDNIPWYGYRFNFTRPENPDNAWYLSSTATNLTVYEIHNKWNNTYPSVPGGGTLSALDTLYGAEKILFIDIIASYASSSPPCDSYLDGVTIILDNGDTAIMNLVPEPATIALLGLGALTFVRRKK